MEDKIKEAISVALHNKFIQNFIIEIENISHQHATHFTGNGNTHFNVTITSEELFAKKPLERHKILNNSTSSLMNEIHAISFKVLKI